MNTKQELIKKLTKYKEENKHRFRDIIYSFTEDETDGVKLNALIKARVENMAYVKIQGLKGRKEEDPELDKGTKEILELLSPLRTEEPENYSWSPFGERHISVYLKYPNKTIAK